MAEYIKPEKDRYIKLSQALEVLDSCACWWAHDRMELIHAADVRPVVRGRWITMPYMIGNTHYCSRCNENYGMEYSFCPNCGADMRGGT